MNDSWRWAKTDCFVDHAHHPLTSALYNAIVLGWSPTLANVLVDIGSKSNELEWMPTPEVVNTISGYLFAISN